MPRKKVRGERFYFPRWLVEAFGGEPNRRSTGPLSIFHERCAILEKNAQGFVNRPNGRTICSSGFFGRGRNCARSGELTNKERRLPHPTTRVEPRDRVQRTLSPIRFGCGQIFHLLSSFATRSRKRTVRHDVRTRFPSFGQ